MYVVTSETSIQLVTLMSNNLDAAGILPEDAQVIAEANGALFRISVLMCSGYIEPRTYEEVLCLKIVGELVRYPELFKHITLARDNGLFVELKLADGYDMVEVNFVPFDQLDPTVRELVDPELLAYEEAKVKLHGEDSDWFDQEELESCRHYDEVTNA
jgi:hypothetical protein